MSGVDIRIREYKPLYRAANLYWVIILYKYTEMSIYELTGKTSWKQDHHKPILSKCVKQPIRDVPNIMEWRYNTEMGRPASRLTRGEKGRFLFSRDCPSVYQLGKGNEKENISTTIAMAVAYFWMSPLFFIYFLKSCTANKKTLHSWWWDIKPETSNKKPWRQQEGKS